MVFLLLLSGCLVYGKIEPFSHLGLIAQVPPQGLDLKKESRSLIPLTNLFNAVIDVLQTLNRNLWSELNSTSLDLKKRSCYFGVTRKGFAADGDWVIMNQ
ncbi:hypothetical protein HS088_TW23G00208 [Tripterygium wilfordii]|uniref:Uncharacterized protein n=1 Tax=Tripterygium wilfordii TaxID=458696 RepID=A0A7J7BVB6_TRIWF|nr:hypothetical protein HS088_TW23G00208 [Tripterygium wilfordii]